MDLSGDRGRRSPVVFDAEPLETGLRDGWEVVLSYSKQDEGPFLVDLSHLRKWDIQHASLSTVRPWGFMFPPSPGQCRVEAGRLLSRRNFTQASIWHLTDGGPEADPDPYFTDVTDGLCLLAVVGARSFAVMEKVSSLDLAFPKSTPPFLLQGPVLHVPCQVAVLAGEGQRSLILVAFSRGYGQAMAEAFLESGHTLGLRPGGENVFRRALDTLHASQGEDKGSSQVDRNVQRN